jgi:hypothetical protein
MNKEKKSKNKIKLFLTRLMSWKVFLIIFFVFLFLEFGFSVFIFFKFGFSELLPDLRFTLSMTLIFVIFYHLLITLPSVILDNFDKYLKTFIHSLVLIALFFVIVIFLGIPMYENMRKEQEKYSKMNQIEQQDKIESTKTNHSNIKAFIEASFKKCSEGATLITLGNKKVFCNSDSIASSFAAFFNTVHVNTYINSIPSIVVSNKTTPALGASNINHSDNKMTIITNVGDEGGGNVYINSTIVRKEYSNED